MFPLQVVEWVQKAPLWPTLQACGLARWSRLMRGFARCSLSQIFLELHCTLEAPDGMCYRVCNARAHAALCAAVIVLCGS